MVRIKRSLYPNFTFYICSKFICIHIKSIDFYRISINRNTLCVVISEISFFIRNLFLQQDDCHCVNRSCSVWIKKTILNHFTRFRFHICVSHVPYLSLYRFFFCVNSIYSTVVCAVESCAHFFLEHISIVHVSRIVVAIAPIAVFTLFLYRNERKLKPHTKIILKSLVNRPRAVNIIVYLTQCLKSQKCSVCAYVYKCADFFCTTSVFPFLLTTTYSCEFMLCLFFPLLICHSMLYSIHIQFLFMWNE